MILEAQESIGLVAQIREKEEKENTLEKYISLP